MRIQSITYGGSQLRAPRVAIAVYSTVASEMNTVAPADAKPFYGLRKNPTDRVIECYISPTKMTMAVPYEAIIEIKYEDGDFTA